MESLPPRQASQRRPSPPQAPPRSNLSPVRTRSEDSQTIFLNSPKSEHEQTQADDQDQKQPSPPTLDKDADPSVKKCWICFSDSTEDTAESSPWRDPCPCALVAHEECLLDWIADMEAPNNNRRTQSGLGSPKIECPQCKSEIKLARPTNLIVDAVRGVERLAAQLIVPGAVTLIGGITYHSSMAFGMHSVYAVFGSEDGFRILEPIILDTIRPPLDLDASTPRDIGRRILGATVNYLVHWRLYVGLPLITPIVVLSRTSLADSILPVLPILFFATQTHAPNETVDFGQWPPSASLAFAILPYVRSAYGIFHSKVFAEREKRWLNEIQPRVRDGQVEDAAGADGNLEQDAAARDQEDGNVFEVRIDGGLWEDWEDDDNGIVDDPHQRAQPGAEEPQPLHFQMDPQNVPANQAEPPPNIADNRQRQGAQEPGVNAAGAPHQHQHQAARGQRRLSFSPIAIAGTFLGALAFPTIANLSGEMLKLVLPRSWTVPVSSSGLRGARIAGKGLLQEKWARSLVGGCLFVVLKDCVMLYVRWKMAQMHRKRRIVDYAGKTKNSQQERTRN